MKKIIISMICPKLEHAAVVWSQEKKKDKEIGKNTEASDKDGA